MLLEAHQDDYYYPYICDDTDDKVFLLSYMDYVNSSYGFSATVNSTNTRYCKPTDYAIANYCNMYEGGSYDRNCYYWTRSPYSEVYGCAWCVSAKGILNGLSLERNYCGVRPALNINL